MKWISLVWLPVLTLAVSLRGQDFTNLNFESAHVVFASTNNGYYYLTTENALPGWLAFSRTNQLSLVQYNYSFAGSGPYPPVGLFGEGANPSVIDGNFSILLGGGAVSQTGLVPNDSKFLLFDAVQPQSSFLVFLGGIGLSYKAISSGVNAHGVSYSVYSANISAFAGKIETLTFSSLTGTYGILDDIQFLPGAVPEPSPASLLFLGGGILLYARKWHQLKRQC